MSDKLLNIQAQGAGPIGSGLFALSRWLIAVAIDYLFIALACLAVGWFGWWAVPISMFVIGNRQHAIAVLGHDGAHGAAIDTLTELLCFWPLGIDLRAYRKFHFAHHRWLGSERDPELNWKREATPNEFRPDASTFRIIGSCVHAFIFGWKEMLAAFKHIGLPPAGSYVLLIAAIGYLPLWVIALWLASQWTTFWVVFRARAWTEHVGTTGTIKYRAPLWQRVLFLPHNTWMHWEHHDAPGIAFHKLKRS